MTHNFNHIDRRTFIAGTTAAGAGYLLGSELSSAATVELRKALPKTETDLNQLKQLRKAVKILRDKDNAAPGGTAADGWIALAHPHVQHCFTGDSNEIHFSWSFLPWHRAYLIAVERRLQHVISDPTLRLPYWDWFSVDQLPEGFAKETYNDAGQMVPNPLFDSTRAKTPANRAPPFFGADGQSVTVSVLGNYDNEVDLLRPAAFTDVGGGANRGESGAIETGPHNSMHVWVGGTHLINGRRGGNMAQAFSPRDPAFLLHHGNIDRLWTVWLNLTTGGPHKNPTATAWLNRTFALPHHTGVGEETYKVADLLDTTKWGYSYDKEVAAVPTAAATVLEAEAGEPVSIDMNSAPLDLSSGKAKTEERTIAEPGATPTAPPTAGRLVLSDVKLPSSTVAFAVYYNVGGSEPSPENLVARHTVLNPTGDTFAGLDGVKIVVPIPDRVLAKITEHPDVSFTIVAEEGGQAEPSAAPTANFEGVSIGKVKLELQ